MSKPISSLLSTNIQNEMAHGLVVKTMTEPTKTNRLIFTQRKTLHEAKKQLKKILNNLKKLQERETFLKQNIKIISDNDWKNEIHNITDIQKSIKEDIHEYELPETINNLKKLIQSRKRKRLYQSRLNTVLKLKKQKQLLHRKKLHEKIDKWIMEKRSKNLQIIQSKEVAQRAEIILSGVTKKKTDAKKYLQLLDSLKELRMVRKIAAQKNDRGEVEFERKIESLKAVWNDALEEYETEESELRKALHGKNKTNEDQWLETLFGKNIETKIMKNNTTFNEFVDIRRAWDSCIVPNDFPFGSSIPIGWVMPNENPSDKWAVYRNLNI